jgi:hypothetical protein
MAAGEGFELRYLFSLVSFSEIGKVTSEFPNRETTRIPIPWLTRRMLSGHFQRRVTMNLPGNVEKVWAFSLRC